MKKHLLIAFLSAAAALQPLLAETPMKGIGWPLQLTAPHGTVLIYQPQPESFKGDLLTARAAVSVRLKGKETVSYGAAWFDAHVSADKAARTVRILRIEVPKVKFPNSTPEDEKKFSDFVSAELAQMELTMTLDGLAASLETAERESSNVDLRNDPPKIVFANSPTVLVTLDGQPEMRPLENSRVMRVVNTPFAMVFDPSEKAYFLKSGESWLKGTDLAGSWQPVVALPESVKSALPADMTAPSKSKGEEPEVIVATEPTELIVTDGEPKFTPLPGNELLYVSNTSSDVFLEIEQGKYYVLLAGRWYSAALLSGPWAYVQPKELPVSFAKIPTGSPKANVLSQVPGTEEAEAVVAEASIPQTQSLRRDEPVDLKAGYDGEPKFEQVEGTTLQSATNTPLSIVKSDERYYCCKDAAWYEASQPNGPWTLCVDVPKPIYTIPPSSPVYNVTYVKVYETRPDYVTFGYTSGYTGVYASGGTVVYGTGYRYRPWVGGVFFARPATWGFGIRYNSHTDSWGVGVSIGGVSAWYGSALSWGGSMSPYSGWWGVGGYRNYGDYNRKVEYNYSNDYSSSYKGGNNTTNNYYGGNNDFSNIGNKNNNWGNGNNNGNGNGNRPNWGNNNRPGNGNGSQRPDWGNNNRPGSGNRPGGNDRPGRPGDGNGGMRPGGERPTTLPAQLPDGMNRPGNGGRPGSGERPGKPDLSQRPTTLPADLTGGADRLPGKDKRPSGDKGQLSRPAQPSVRPATGMPNNIFAGTDGNVYRKSKDGWETRDSSGWQRPDAKPSSRPSSRDSKNSSSRDARPSQRPSNDRSSNLDRARPQLERDNQARERGKSSSSKPASRPEQKRDSKPQAKPDSKPQSSQRPSSGSRPSGGKRR